MRNSAATRLHLTSKEAGSEWRVKLAHEKTVLQKAQVESKAWKSTENNSVVE